MLPRLIRAANPLRSFRELHGETGIPLPMLYTLSLHLTKWSSMRLVATLSESSVLCVNPAAVLAPSSSAAVEYALAFGPRPPLSWARLLQLFATPQRFGELLRRADGLPPRRVVQLTIFLWQRYSDTA